MQKIFKSNANSVKIQVFSIKEIFKVVVVWFTGLCVPFRVFDNPKQPYFNCMDLNFWRENWRACKSSVTLCVESDKSYHLKYRYVEYDPFYLATNNAMWTQLFSFQIIHELANMLVSVRAACSYGHRYTWWRHQRETFSALLAICAGNSPVPGEFSAQRPVTRSFDVLFDPGLNKQLGKQLWGWWFETLSCSLWRHCNDLQVYGIFQLKRQEMSTFL